MTTQYAVIRVLTNSSDQISSSVELTTANRSAALAKYYEVLADAVTKVASGRLADGAYLVDNDGAVQAHEMFKAPATEEE
jgi:hypothetical protein